MHPTQPPWLAERILGLAIRNQDEREMVLGDLHEEWLAHRSTGRRASGWYWRQAMGLTLQRVTPGTGAHGRTARSGDSMMGTLLMNVKLATRSLLKRPALTAIVMVTLALGIGANAAVFNMIDVLVLHPYPLPGVDRMVLLAETGPGIEYRKGSVSPANFLDWREHAATLQSLSGMQWWDANLIAMQEPERLQGYFVSSSFFDAIGVQPALGRGLVRDDETMGSNLVAMSGDGLWKGSFNR
jgi:hypothetical protein